MMQTKKEIYSFTLIRNHKVLKHIRLHLVWTIQFYTYKKSQGSQTEITTGRTRQQFYTYKKSQGSQTEEGETSEKKLFYTYKKLQGSQTTRQY